MRTARLLPVSPGMHCSWRCTQPWRGAGVLVQGGVPGPGGCTWSRGCTWFQGVYLVWGCTWSWGGTWSWGRVPGHREVYLVRGCVYLAPGGCTWSQGVVKNFRGCTWSRGGVPGLGGCTCPSTLPLWTEFLTHASENITLPRTSFAGGNKRHQYLFRFGMLVIF